MHAITALNAPPRTKPSNYPEPFRSRMTGRTKRPLGDLFGLTHFGVNITTVQPGAVSALRHSHSKQDEFIYVISGTFTLRDNTGETLLTAGSCVGFKAGDGNAHHLVNSGTDAAVYLEIGNRSEGDVVSYPEDDLVADFMDGGWVFSHKDSTPYP